MSRIVYGWIAVSVVAALAIAQELDPCFEECHTATMELYETGEHSNEYLNGYFHGCLDGCEMT